MKYFSVCGLPSSRISKCSPVRSVSRSPRRSRTVTPKLTRSVSARNTVCCAKARATATSTTVATITPRRMATILYECLPRRGHFCRQLLDPSKIGLSGTECRNRLDVVHVFSLRQPEARQVGLAEPFPQHLCRHQWIGEEGHQSLTTRLVGHGCDHAGVRFAEELTDRFLHFDVRDHFPAELAETR